VTGPKKGGSVGRTGNSASDPAELEAQIAAARDRLAVSIDQISARVAPSAIADAAKSRVRAIVINPDGSIKKDKAAIVGGVGFTIVLWVAWRHFH
jgi:hypothetical protein